jgi:hypothetical protein
MGKLIDITGKRFGSWTVLALHPERMRRDKSIRAVWCCRCDCGIERVVSGSGLRGGRSISCGCAINHLTIHGHARRGGRTRAYRCWVGMWQRCANPNNARYADYGGRGITVCERWRSFVNFLADMDEPPPGMSIERSNNDGNYEPKNCCWATRVQQIHNRRPLKRKRRRAALEDIQAYAAALARAAGQARSAS